MSLNKLARRVCTGAAASVLMVPLAQAAKLAVNDEVPLTIVSPGFTYITNQPGIASELSVTTDGYLFCANVGPSSPNIVALAPGHSRWTLPEAYLLATSYSGGDLRVNIGESGSIEHSLSCQARGAKGEVFNPYSRFGIGIFQNGYEELEATQYSNLVNWTPAPGFDWSAPDWSEVPTDSCQFSMTAENSPRVDEPALCAAATGIVPGGEFGTRSPKMWTQHSGTNFIYLARIDARLGQQELNVSNAGFGVQMPQGVNDLPTSIVFEVRDGFDSQYLTSNYTACFLSELPESLTSTTCNNNQPFDGVGIVNTYIPLSFLTVPTLSRYLVVIRAKTNDLPPIQTPVAAVAVLSDPLVARSESGDTFAGDNVIFGFSLAGDGFPWMTP